jgi:hypothetical protein
MRLLHAVAVFITVSPLSAAAQSRSVTLDAPAIAPPADARPAPIAGPRPRPRRATIAVDGQTPVTPNPSPVIPPAPASPVVVPTPQAPPAAVVAPMPAAPPSPFIYHFDDELIHKTMEAVKVELEELKNFKFDIRLEGVGDLERAGLLDPLMQDKVLMAQDQARLAQEKAREIQESARRAAEDVRRSVQIRDETGNAYSNGLNYLNQRQYDRAIGQFDRVIAQKAVRTDGAMYHKSFALFRSGRSQEALETIATLRRDFPQSPYLNDARVLEADIRRLGGQPISPSAADDDEIKLLAIQGLQRSEQAIPLLEGVLGSANSLRVKKQALFVLAANDDARARATLLRYARGDANPDLQMDAIRYLISRRDAATSRDLREIYNGTQDSAVRIAIINAYQSASDKAALLEIAANRSAGADLRGRAVSGLSSLLSPDELYAMYQQETDAAVRLHIVSALGAARAIDHLARAAGSDADAGVRRRAVSALGGMRGDQGAKARQALQDIYAAQTDSAIRLSIINALNHTEGAEALVSLARKETTLDLKRVIVQRLSELAPRSKVAADYLMEVIK